MKTHSKSFEKLMKQSFIENDKDKLELKKAIRVIQKLDKKKKLKKSSKEVTKKTIVSETPIIDEWYNRIMARFNSPCN